MTTSVNAHEVRDGDDETFGGRDLRRQPEQNRGEDPQRPLRVAAERSAQEQERHADQLNGAMRGSRALPSPTSRARTCPRKHDDEVSESERQTLPRTLSGNSKGDDEEAAHPSDQQQPDP